MAARPSRREVREEEEVALAEGRQVGKRRGAENKGAVHQGGRGKQGARCTRAGAAGKVAADMDRHGGGDLRQ